TVEAISLAYNAKKQTVNKMTYKENGIVMKEVAFTRDAEEGKLTKIEETYEDGLTAKIASGTLSRFYIRFCGDEAEMKSMLKAGNSKAMQLTKTIEVVYDSEFENIIETTTSIYKFNFVHKKSFKYDKGNNPYFGLPYFYSDNLNFDLVGFSKNNVREFTVVSNQGDIQTDSTTSTYTYMYNKKQFPTRIIKTTKQIPVNTYILYKE
ncbi:MAG: hypothetical protein LBL18_01685, partial [Bacteroidales bacterium]|nr:hypothetical protein [Bacteroidales bacterium]